MGRRAWRWLVAAGVLCAVGPAEAEERDPWEPVNRPIFALNEAVDIHVLEPVARGWDFVIPELAQISITNFFNNLAQPLIVGNHVLQGEPRKAWEDLARFIVDSTFGVGGLYDAGSDLGIPDNETDFGVTMGKWGVPPGPFVMLPVWGPSSVRDAAGLVPTFFATPYQYVMPFWGSLILRSFQVVNTRSYYLDEIAEERAAALDFYAFQRDAYLQNREFKVEGGRVAPDEEEVEDLYYFDDEDFEEVEEPEDE